jgi:glycosyltransferase involved in cell wall biosynthesis
MQIDYGMIMLNILLNIDSLFTPHRTGIPHYTWHLQQGMVKHPDVSLLYTFTGSRFVKNPFGQVLHASTLDSFFHRLKEVPILQNVMYKWSDRLFATFRKKRASLVYHEPNFIMKPFAGACVTTLHDLTCIRFPQFQPTKRVIWFQRGLERTLTQAHHIISVSEFSKQEAVHYLGIKPEKITVVPNGISTEFHPREPPEMELILARYKLSNKRYILSVSTLEPRKNLLNLLKGYLNLPASLRKAYPLVFVGAIGWKIDDFMRKIRATSEEVRLLGYLPQEHLPFLFAGAKAFGYISFYEGFGLPVLEALASGLPVLTSTNSAMAEFTGKQTVLVDPLDVDAISQGLREVTLNESLASEASAMVNHYHQDFSWERCIAKTVAVLKRMESD